MADNTTETTMQRKAGAGRPPPEIGVLNAASVLRAAIAQGGEDALGLICAASKISESRSNLTGFVENLPDHALLTLCKLDGDTMGMAVLDCESLAALIEFQTTGRVVANPAKARGATGTDALLASGFINQVLGLFEQGAAEAELDVAPAITGFRYATHLADARAVLMTLDDQPYRIFEASVSFSDGAKDGRMWLLYPYEIAAANDAAGQANWQAELSSAVECTHVEMEAVLARKHMPLREVSELQVGAVIVLPREVVSQITIHDIDGRKIGMGRLGQASGFRAVCLSQPCDTATPSEPDFANSTAPPLEIPVELDDGPVDISPIPDPEGLPDLAAMGDFPNAGDLADLGDFSADAGDLPDLANLGDAGELPDLAGL